MKLHELFEAKEIPEAEDLNEFAQYHEQDFTQISYKHQLYTWENHSFDHTNVKQAQYSARGMSDITISHLNSLKSKPYEIVAFDPEETPPFEGEVLIPKDFLSVELGSLNKDTALKEILTIYKRVIAHDSHGASFEGDFKDSKVYLEMIMSSLYQLGIDWPELKAIYKSMSSK